MIARLLLALMLLFGAAGANAQSRAKPPLVLAAASLQEAMTAAADAWAAGGRARPVLSFAASSALARQAQAGAPADLFVSADEEWMDVLQRAGALRPGTRATFLGNRLVLVARMGTRGSVDLRRGLARLLGPGERLAMADPSSVPAGRYGQAALERLGAWPAVSGRIARAENVRAALALVERGATPYGVVYATDARASGRVRIAAVFPANSHPPIRYPLAILRRSDSPDAEPFRRFLLSPRGRAIFARFGFTTAR